MGPESKALVLAYRVGRLLNQFSFHAQHAWFFHPGHYKATEEVGRELARKARELVPVATRDQHQRELTRSVEALLGALISQDRCENLIEDEQRLGFIYDPADFIPLRAESLAPVFTALDELRRMITSPLSDTARLAFRLGELVDEGVRPPKVYRYMTEADARAGHDPDAPRQQAVDAPGDSAPDVSPEHEAAASAETDPNASPEQDVDEAQEHAPLPEPDHTLRGAPVRPGGVPLNIGWVDEIRQLLGELGATDTLPAQVLQAAEGSTVGNGEEIVEQLDLAVHTALAGSRMGDVEPKGPVLVFGAEAGVMPEPPGSVTDDFIPVIPASAQMGGRLESTDSDEIGPEKVAVGARLKFDRSTKSVILDGTRIDHLDPRAFRLLKGIADATANDERATSKSLGQDHLGGYLREHLPPQLYALVESRGSRGGGYWLTLPPKKP